MGLAMGFNFNDKKVRLADVFSKGFLLLKGDRLKIEKV